jgi:hypothetical protein
VRYLDHIRSSRAYEEAHMTFLWCLRFERPLNRGAYNWLIGFLATTTSLLSLSPQSEVSVCPRRGYHQQQFSLMHTHKYAD